MGRNAAFTGDDLIQAALAIISKRGAGAVTISAIRDELGAPTGSIYHRYGSIRHILAEAWLSAVESFQAGFLTALDGGGIDGALFTPRWTRANPLESRTLLCYRREDLVAGKWPGQVKGRADRLGRELSAGIGEFTARHFVAPSAEQRALVRFAVIDMPCAAVRPYLEAGTPVPQFIDDFIRRAYAALMKK